MAVFAYIFIGTALFVSVLSVMVKRKYNRYFLLPGIIISVLSGIVAFVSYFLTNGWDSMGYFFMFVSITLGSIVGSIFSYFMKNTVTN